MPNARPNDGDFAARLIHVESMMAHFQRTMQELDQVVIEQGRSLNDLAGRIRRLAAELATLQDATVEEPDEDEPPS